MFNSLASKAYAQFLIINSKFLINNELFIILISLIAANNNLLTRLQALNYLIILRILATDGYLSAISLLATLV